MGKQSERINIRVDDEIKKKFEIRCNTINMTISSRIKYLLKMDIENKLKIDE